MNARCATGYCAHRISLSYHIHAWPSGGTLDCRNIIGNIRAARLSTTGAPHRRVSLCYFIPGFTRLGDSGGILFSYWILIWKHTFVLICWFPIGKVTRLWSMSTKVKWIMVWKLWCLFTTCLCFFTSTQGVETMFSVHIWNVWQGKSVLLVRSSLMLLFSNVNI